MNKLKLSLANPFFAILLLTAVFALTAVATLAANRLLGRKFDNQPTHAELSQARSDAIAAIPQLPKDTEEKLSAALHPELTPITAAFVDPLIKAFFRVDFNFQDLSLSESLEADVILVTVRLNCFDVQNPFGKTECQMASAPIGDVEMGIKVFCQYSDWVMLEIAPFIGDNRLAGGYINVTG